MTHEETTKCSKCQRTSVVVDLVNACPFCDKPMTYTEKRLEEFEEKFTEVSCECGARDLFDFSAVKSFISTSIAQALAEERARMRGVIGRMEKKNTERHTEGCRGFKNQIYFAGDSLGGSCTCAPILDRDYTQYNQALNDILSSLDKPKE